MSHTDSANGVFLRSHWIPFLKQTASGLSITTTPFKTITYSPSMLNCPYVEGALMPLVFHVERTNKDHEGYPLMVRIKKPFYPFTSAQAMLVEATSPTPPGVPNQLVLKLEDRRFRRALTWGCPYDPSLDLSIRKGLYGIVHEGKKPNPFELLGGNDEEPDRGTIPWMDQVDDWCRGQYSFMSEVDAYRRLRPFQGRLVPRMYGTVRYDLRHASDVVDPTGFTHPVLDAVNGIALEYIEGTTVQNMKVGVDVTEEEADRIAHGTFSVLRELRQHRIIHNDLRTANVMVRKGDFDHPVLIDLAFMIFKSPEQSDDDFAYRLPYSPVVMMRRLFANDGFHMPSPYPSWCREDPESGFAFFNGQVERLRPDWRSRLFEPIEPDHPERVYINEHGIQCTWYPALWKPKPGIRFAPDSDLDRV